MIEKAVARTDEIRGIPANEQAMLAAMRSIPERSTEMFCVAMVNLGKSLSRIRLIDAAFKLVDVPSHGMWELARRTNPEVTSNWNVCSLLPWDRGLHEWRMNNIDAMNVIERSNVDARDSTLPELLPPRD
ncbi:MAG: hypothetical protein AAGG48_18195 [Planctomycetota bacterium]